MKQLFILIFLTASLLFLNISYGNTKTVSNEKKSYTVISVMLKVKPGDGYFTITRRLFKALHLAEEMMTWKHVQYIQKIYKQKYDTEDLKVGNEITILKSEFTD